MLASKKTSLNHLILANNKIGKEGGHSLVRALASARLLVGPAAASTQRNKSGRSGAPPISHGEEKRICGDNTSLQTLNIRMNRIGDEGGAEFFKILSKNETLKFIDLAANGLGRESVNSLCVLIRKNLKNLRGIDVSCNKLGSSSNNSNGAVVNATASNSSDATPAANQSPVLTTNQSAIDAANSAINNSAEKQPRVGSARDGDPGHAVEPDESGKLLFEAITHNKVGCA